MGHHLQFHEFRVRGLPKDFSIDAQFELAKTIYSRHLDDSDGMPVRLTHSQQLCTNRVFDNCAIWREPRRQCQEEAAAVLTNLAKETLFAVKTCKKYHEQRLPVIMETWGKAAYHLDLISEAEDDVFQTLVLPDIRHNTDRGHCMKTEAIFKHFRNITTTAGNEDWKWLVIADDDTILSVAKVLAMLNCYDPDADVAIGQRYGFQVAGGQSGYDYPTGGAGMIFSRGLVRKMLANKWCKCPTPDHPDDMHIGSCLATLGVSMVHSDRLHQGRAEDYSPELLNAQDPVSFHKFWSCDPIRTYHDWFAAADQDLADWVKDTKNKRRDEL